MRQSKQYESIEYFGEVETNNIKHIEFAEVPTETGEYSPFILVII